jgi:hypothetical protein
MASLQKSAGCFLVWPNLKMETPNSHDESTNELPSYRRILSDIHRISIGFWLAVHGFPWFPMASGTKWYHVAPAASRSMPAMPRLGVQRSTKAWKHLEETATWDRHSPREMLRGTVQHPKHRSTTRHVFEETNKVKQSKQEMIGFSWCWMMLNASFKWHVKSIFGYFWIHITIILSHH